MLHFDGRDHAVALLITVLVILTLVEMTISYVEDRKLYQSRDTWTNLYLTTLALFVNLGVKLFTFFVLNAAWHHRFVEIRQPIVYWVVLLVLQDFLYWLLHATGHYCRVFWAMHVTHHSSEHFNLTTGFRSTVFEPLYRVFFFIPLSLLGFDAIDTLYAYMIVQIYGNLVHTQYKVPLPKWYGWVFVTPSHHRVHHASNVPYLDKNMGMMLIVWDRLFGTFRDENLAEPIRYGLTHQPQDMGPANVLFHEWKALVRDVRSAPGWRNKLGYLFRPPGWSHDGSTHTARVMQREYERDFVANVARGREPAAKA